MAVRFFDTRARTKVELHPPKGRPLLVYVCGVTVYDLCHLGHARSAIAFDVIVRYLRARGFDVRFVRNFTDVDDKIIRKANQEGTTAQEIAERFIAEYYKDMDALGILKADVEPRVTETMDEIVAMVADLVDQGHAYVVDGDVYFEVSSFPEYGKLSGRNPDEMLSGARIEVDPRKRSPLDFALWKAAKPGEPAWESPWGKGRPGWHIECSAMMRRVLGQTIDIHGGGKDLIFPHHENEIAQSEAANSAPLAHHWIHNGFVNVPGGDGDDTEVKMSKSLGNFFTIQEVRKLYDPEVLRYFMLTTHYRSPITFTKEALAEADRRLAYLYETLDRVEDALDDYDGPATPSEDDLARVHEAMDDDFNTAAVLGILAKHFKTANELVSGVGDFESEEERLHRLASFRMLVDRIGGFLGILEQAPAAFLEHRQALAAQSLPMSEDEIEALVLQRDKARRDRHWAEADKIRDLLKDKGIILKDTPDGTTWSIE